MDGNTQPVASSPSKAKQVMLWILSIVVAAMFIMAERMTSYFFVTGAVT
jgi:hypothetical protein